MTPLARIAITRPVCAACPRKKKFIGPLSAIVICRGGGRLSLCNGVCPDGWWDARDLSTGPVVVDEDQVKFAGLSSLPGDAVALVLSKMGVERVKGCGCAKMQKWMNDLGWARCLTTHLPNVVTWFSRKAAENGIETGPAQIAQWFIAVARELR